MVGRESLARALVGVVEVVAEMLKERPGLLGQRQRPLGVLARGFPGGVAEQARAGVGVAFARRDVDVAAAQRVAQASRS